MHQTRCAFSYVELSMVSNQELKYEKRFILLIMKIQKYFFIHILTMATLKHDQKQEATVKTTQKIKTAV